MILVSEALVDGNSSAERCARDVHTLLKENWDIDVSSHALRTLCQDKRNRPKLLPITSDVILLSRYLKQEAEQKLSDLTKAVTVDALQPWRALANITLTKIMLFNRKRQGEISKLSLEDFGEIKRGESHVLDVQTLTKWKQL